ncbi:hypothetical protein LSAT2_014020, partial [Lamellibrachia satsuma]
MLKELASSIHSLKVVLRDEQRLIALFWLTELPQYGNHGNVTDGRLLKEKEQLAGELMGMRSKYSHLKRELKSMQHKLEVRRPATTPAPQSPSSPARCHCGLLEKYNLLKQELKAAYEILETNNRRKEKIEKAIAKE